VGFLGLIVMFVAARPGWLVVAVRPGRDRARPARAARSVVVPAGRPGELRRQMRAATGGVLDSHRAKFGSTTYVIALLLDLHDVA